VPPTVLTRAKSKILTVHRWLALIAGLFLMSQGLTGSLIAFRYELNRALHAGVLTVAPRAGPPPLGDVIKAAESALPGTRVSRVHYPRAVDDATIARLVHSGEWLGLPGRRLSWSAALVLTIMAISGYMLWIMRTLRRRNGRSARPVMGGR
jgi:uncharacterized iron-regulated membrane protein